MRVQVFVVCLNDSPHSVVLTELEAKEACAKLSAQDPGPMKFYHYREVPMVFFCVLAAGLLVLSFFVKEE